VAKTLAASHQTRPGAIKGKLAYMAPEQLRGSAVDRRSDLFAVAVMLWEMLAGRRMWHGMTDVEIVAHLAAARPMPMLPPDPGLPPGLDVICARALDPDPECRYQTAAEMEMEIEGVLVGWADSHVRNLGKVVSMAFAEERAARQALIERHARRAETAGATNDIAAGLPSESGSVEVTLSGLFTAPGSADAPLPAGAAPVAFLSTSPTSVVWWRRAATVSGIVAMAALGALVGGWRAHSGGSGVAVAAGPATVARPNGSSARAAAEPAPAPTRPAKASASGDAEPRRHRRHRPIEVDEDATLPMSEELGE
jgi:serine/threonine-protein kinase